MHENVCSMLSFHSYDVSTLAAVWPVSSATITFASLVERQLLWYAGRQNWMQEWHKVIFSDEPSWVCSILMAVYVSRSSEETWRLHSISAKRPCTWNDNLDSYWVHNRLISSSNHQLFKCRLIHIWYQSYIQWLCPFLEAYEMPFFNKIMQDHMLHIMFWPSSVHRLFSCCPGMQSPQICHSLKISDHVLLSACCHPSLTNIADEVWHRLKAA